MSYEQIVDCHEKLSFGNNVIVVHHSNFEEMAFKKYFMPSNPISYGKNLYAVLRDLDKLDFDAIYIENPPTDLQWMAIEDRILKASHK